MCYTLVFATAQNMKLLVIEVTSYKCNGCIFLLHANSCGYFKIHNMGEILHKNKKQKDAIQITIFSSLFQNYDYRSLGIT